MDNSLFEALLEVELLSLLLYGEARGEGSLDSLLGVGSVARNRVKESPKYGVGYRGVILKRKQFSCFNEGDVNRGLLEICAMDFQSALDKNWAFKACYWVAKGIIDGMLITNVGQANHYFASSIEPPYWVKDMQLMRVIKNHSFYYG